VYGIVAGSQSARQLDRWQCGTSLAILTVVGVPSMRRVVGALLGSIPGLSSIALVLLLIYYVFAVIATKLFGEHFPQWFGSIGESLYSLFQIMTLESWPNCVAK
jgi:voltage-gated sodium channel